MSIDSQLESGLLTSLRPDFHEWFPVFSPEQMRERLATMPFEMATLLRPRNIRLAMKIASPRPYLAYLRKPLVDKQIALKNVLVARGISVEIAEAVAHRRHEFVRTHHRPVAYMDRSLPVVGHTYLSAPGLVSLMLAMSPALPNAAVVCELGIGTGLHALCLARLMPNARLIGVERNPPAIEICRAIVERADMSERFEVVSETETLRAISRADFIYSTAALSLAQLGRLTGHGRVGSTWLVPRQLTRKEFESEPPSSWLWQRYGDYEGYCQGPWNQYLALERFTLDAGRRRLSHQIVYDVRFVRYRDS